MRNFGGILSLFSALLAIGLLWIGYICIFDEYQVIPDFESQPREGWDYWKRLEFRHDVRAYALWILQVLGCAMIPTLGFTRSGKSVSSHKVADWVLFGISALYLVYWSRVLVIRLPEMDWVLIPSFLMFAGCLYGLLIFWKRARTRINAEAQQVVAPNGP